MYVGRTPVTSGIKKFMNYLSFGRLEKKRKELGYEDIFHSYIIVKLDDGKFYKVERNHIIEEKEITNKDQIKGEVKNIPLDKEIEVGDMIENASKNSKDFWVYDPRDRNCQDFVERTIKNNDLYDNIDDETKEIVKPQDGNALIETLHYFKGVPKTLTDLYSGIDRAIYGNGVNGGKLSVDELFRFVNR